MSIGDNIKKRRFELKMTQQELAEKLGYKSRSSIAKIEAGENDITQARLQKFALALDTDVQSLISGTESFHHSLSVENDHATVDPTKPHKNVAVILAGGKSSRNQQNIPNQFISVLGKPIIIYSMNAYQIHPLIDDIYVVCIKGWESIVKAYAQQFHITKLKGIIPAGKTGVLSFKNSVEMLQNHYDDEDLIIFQESTRPMITVEIISKLIQSANALGSATICQKMSDYLQFSVDGYSEKLVNRETTIDAQSPDAYQFKVVKNIIAMAEKKQHPFTETCSSMLLYHLGYPIHFVEGSINNPKIIRQEDITVIAALLKNKY